MIKLKTEFTPITGGGIWTNACKDCLYHDAAVAHALVEAMERYNGPGHKVLAFVSQRAAEILVEDFGIEE